MNPPCLLVIASFRKISTASNRVLCDQPIHPFFAKLMLMALCRSTSSGKPSREKPVSFHFSQVPTPFALVLCTYFPHLGSVEPSTRAQGRAFSWDIRGDTALLGAVWHSELHSSGSKPVAWGVIRRQCRSVMNVSG